MIETFDLVVGQLGFASTAARDAAQTRITNFLAGRPRFRDEEPTYNPVNTGKYGGVAGLGVTIRMSSRSDADALWADIAAGSFSVLQSGSWVEQNAVTFDSAAGTQTVTPVHHRSFPAQQTDF